SLRQSEREQDRDGRDGSRNHCCPGGPRTMTIDDLIRELEACKAQLPECGKTEVTIAGRTLENVWITHPTRLQPQHSVSLEDDLALEGRWERDEAEGRTADRLARETVAAHWTGGDC